MDANFPDLIESAPKPGPTDLSSTISKGAGKAPALKRTARSAASWLLKLPVIIPEPPVIAVFITGAVITTPSKITANLLPTFSEVALPNFCAPVVSNLNDTAWPCWESKDALASVSYTHLTLQTNREV